MDPAQAAQQVTTVLAPALPYLFGKVADGAAAEAGKKLAAGALDRGKAILARLWRGLSRRTPAGQAVEQLAQQPDSPDWRQALTQALETALAQDRALAQDLIELLRDAPATTQVEVHGHDHQVAVGQGAKAAGPRAVIAEHVAGIVQTGDHASAHQHEASAAKGARAEAALLERVADARALDQVARECGVPVDRVRAALTRAAQLTARHE